MVALTVEMETSLKKQLKLLAVKKGKSLKQVSTEAIELYLKTNGNKTLHSSKKLIN